MRFILGIVVGALLVIGAAYVHDAAIDPARDAASQRMVNWEAVSVNLRGIGGWLSDEWEWLTTKLHRPA